MAREFRIIVDAQEAPVELGLSDTFKDFPRTAKIESFTTFTEKDTIHYVALVSWDEEAEARRPKVMERV